MAAQSAVRGPWRVRTIEEGGGRDATARLLDDALLLEHEGGVSVVEFGALAGAEASGARAVLHHATVGTLVLETPQAALLVEALGDAACTIPELTANLRMMGTLRAKPGSDHDRWFGALLDARRHAHAATHPDDRVNAVDAAALRASHEETIEALSLARHPRRAPDRRAFAEELRDVSERYARALEGLSLAAAAMRRSSPAERRRSRPRPEIPRSRSPTSTTRSREPFRCRPAARAMPCWSTRSRRPWGPARWAAISTSP